MCLPRAHTAEPQRKHPRGERGVSGIALRAYGRGETETADLSAKHAARSFRAGDKVVFQLKFGRSGRMGL